MVEQIIKKIVLSLHIGKTYKGNRWQTTTLWVRRRKKRWQTHGRIFVLDRDINGDNRIDIDDLQWDYLEGDGDFQSVEVTKLRDEADFELHHV